VSTIGVFVQLSKSRKSDTKDHPHMYEWGIISEAAQDRCCWSSRDASKNQSHWKRSRNLLNGLCTISTHGDTNTLALSTRILEEPQLPLIEPLQSHFYWFPDTHDAPSFCHPCFSSRKIHQLNIMFPHLKTLEILLQMFQALGKPRQRAGHDQLYTGHICTFLRIRAYQEQRIHLI
jgi:hypothetical protein